VSFSDYSSKLNFNDKVVLISVTNGELSSYNSSWPCIELNALIFGVIEYCFAGGSEFIFYLLMNNEEDRGEKH